MSRLIALVVAVGLIIGAVVVRNAIDSNDDSSRGGGNGSVVRVVCAVEVYDACASLDPTRYEVHSEDAVATAATLTGGSTQEFDVWVAPATWPGVVDDARTRAGDSSKLIASAVQVARSPLALVAGNDVGACDWKCVGGSKLSIGAETPKSSLGTLEVGAAATGFFGTRDFAANDFDAPFRSWLEALRSRIVTNDQPVTTLLQSRAFFDAALSTEADARAQLDAASPDRKAGLSLQYPAPVAYVDVVAVDVDPRRAPFAAAVGRTVGAQLLTRGWKTPTNGNDGLPRPGVLAALRDLL